MQSLRRSAPSRGDTGRILDGLRHVVAVMRAFSSVAQTETGLTAAQLFALQRLAAEGPLTVNALAELTLTHQSTVSVVAKRLEEKKLLRRKPSPADRRQVLLEATAAGRKLAAKRPAAAQDELIAAVESLPARERKTLASLLESVVARLAPADEAPPMFFEPPARAPGRSAQRRAAR